MIGNGCSEKLENGADSRNRTGDLLILHNLINCEKLVPPSSPQNSISVNFYSDPSCLIANLVRHLSLK